MVNSGGIPSAGIVLFSDGIDNSSSQNSDTILRDLASRNIPVFTIPIGLPDPDDVSLRNLVMQEVAYSGDKVPVQIQIQSKGYEKRNSRLSVLLNDRRVSTRVIKLNGGIQFEEIILMLMSMRKVLPASRPSSNLLITRYRPRTTDLQEVSES